jgi:hypothetical protein
LKRNKDKEKARVMGLMTKKRLACHSWVMLHKVRRVPLPLDVHKGRPDLSRGTLPVPMRCQGKGVVVGVHVRVKT